MTGPGKTTDGHETREHGQHNQSENEWHVSVCKVGRSPAQRGFSIKEAEIDPGVFVCEGVVDVY